MIVPGRLESTVCLTVAALLAFQKARCDDSSTVVLRFGGDLLLAEHYERAAGDTPGLAFEGFDLLRTADIAMVNLESPVTTRGTPAVKPYIFRMHPRFLSALADAGIDVVNIANNHIMDYGVDGLLDTFLYLDSAGVHRVGAGRTSAEAHRPVLLKVRGIRVAFLGYYGGGEARGAGVFSPGVARRYPPQMAADIRSLRDSVDLIVVNLHWGTEKAAFPDPSQQGVARGLIDAGADLVIGHHPHVLQGIERYAGGVIAYSLGNFIFGGNSRHTYNTAVLDVAVRRSRWSVRAVPVGVRQWRAMLLEGAEADAVLALLRARSTQFERSIFTEPDVPRLIDSSAH
jgi:poly-gamma-glutamate synthesis protein (capsule biosynthesis protein)